MKTSQLKPISATAPYVAVLIGLYALKNAWIAIGLYHCGMAGFIIAADRNNLLQKARTGWNPIVAILGTAMSAMVVPIIYFSWGYVHLPGEPLAAKLATLGLPGTAWIRLCVCRLPYSCVSMVHKATLATDSIPCADYNSIHMEIYGF